MKPIFIAFKHSPQQCDKKYTLVTIFKNHENLQHHFTESRNKRLMELKKKSMLLSREYPDGLKDSDIDRARAIPHKIALQRKNKQAKSKRPIFAVWFDPRLPSISSIQAKHWRSIVAKNRYLADCFPEPPLTAYRRPNNLREYIIRAKVPPPPETRPKRILKGMTKFGFDCTARPYILEGKVLKSDRKAH